MNKAIQIFIKMDQMESKYMKKYTWLWLGEIYPKIQEYLKMLKFIF